MMLPHAIYLRSAEYVRRRATLPACLQFVFAARVEPARGSTSPRLQKRVLLTCLLMMAGLGGVGSFQATAHATRKAHHHRVHLHWNAPTPSAEAVSGYNIYRSDDNGKTFRKVNRLPVAKTEYNDRSVRHGVSYIYLVKSVGHKGAESGPSNKIRLRVP